MQVVIIDGKNAAFRFAWAYRGLRDDEGQPTGAVYGILRTLLALKKKYPQSRFVVVWDGQRTPNNWRSKIYPGYKLRNGTRPSVINETLAQLGDMQEAARLVGIPAVEVPDVEADDLAGMMASICLARKWEPVIYSTDYDYAQLVCRGVNLIRRGIKGDPFKIESVRAIQEHFGCPIRDVLAVRAFMGDQSDKIPKAMRGADAVAAELVAGGVTPESPQPFGISDEVRLKHPALLRNWDVLHRNYRLMRIVTSWNDPVYAPQRSQLKAALTAATRQLIKPKEPDQRALLDFLLARQCVSLARERRLLLHLNDL